MSIFWDFVLKPSSIALVYLLLGSPVLQDTPQRIQADPERLDFGEVFSGEKPRKKLFIRNKGQGVLELRKVEFNCGCTLSRLTLPSGPSVIPDRKSDAPLGILKSGEAAEMVIEFGTPGLLGKITRHLKIYSNDPSKEALSLEMSIRVKKPFRLEPEALDFESIKKGGSAIRTLKIQSAGVGDFAIKGITGLPAYMDFTAERLAGASPTAYLLTFRLDGKGPSGTRRHKLRLTVENSKVDGIDFFADATILSDLTLRFTPRGHDATLDLGKVSRRRGGSGQVEILGKDTGKPFTILDVGLQCKFKEFVESGIETIQAGGHYRITLRLKPEIKAEYVQGTLIVHGDHEDLRGKKIKFIARIID
jgi:hypothetical protein